MFRITFDSAGSWTFDNDLSRNAIFFGADDSSSSDYDNCKNNFVIFYQSPSYGIDGSFGSPEKKFNINFSKGKIKFSLNLHNNADQSYLFVNGNEIFKCKADNKTVNVLTQFCV